MEEALEFDSEEYTIPAFTKKLKNDHPTLLAAIANDSTSNKKMKLSVADNNEQNSQSAITHDLTLKNNFKSKRFDKDIKELYKEPTEKDMKKIKSLCGTRHSHAGTFDHTKNDSIPAMAL